MEIIHIILGKANPDRLNGVNKVVYQLATAQAEAGLCVQVWGFTAQPVHDYPPRNFKTLLFKTSRNPFGLSKNFINEAAKNKKAVFHIHGGWIPIFYSVSQYFSKQNIKFVFTPHGAYNAVAMQKSFWFKKLYYTFFEKKLIQSAHKIHCLGTSEVISLKQLNSKATSVLIPYGFEGEILEDFSRLKSEYFTIGYMGRIDIHTKGLDLLVNAYAKFASQHPEARLWIIGDGQEKADLEKMCNQLNIKSVKWWGKQFGADKNNIMKQMDVFAHPSRNEGLPSSVMEAAALGVPLLVSEATNTTMYVADYKAGLCVPDADEGAILRAFNTFYLQWKDDHLIQFRKNATKMVKSCFSWKLLVNRFSNELYNS